jgi:ATP adenylyltransferase
MDNKWAPWRAEYIYTCSQERVDCIFCDLPKENKDRDNLILYREELVYIIMNKYPYNNGHLMVVPFKHTSDIKDLSQAENRALWDVLVLCREKLEAVFHPHGFNIGMNIGRPAGAGIDEHVHLHIVPRWNGDTNFMPVFGDVKVISEGLFTTYDRLKTFFK